MAFRLAFMGSPQFSVSPLRAIGEAGHDIAAVYCQPPRPAGRGQNNRLCPVHTMAQKMNLPTMTPVNFREQCVLDSFAALSLDVAIISAYGIILPKEILEAPRLGCINIHASLLPRWRGAAPIQNAIWAGDTHTGITIMQMDEGLDTGPILSTKSTPISDETTGETLHQSLTELGSTLIVETLRNLERGALTPTPQPQFGVTYAGKLNPADSRLNWARPAIELERQIRAFRPWPGSWFEYDGARIKIISAETNGLNGQPGTVLDDQLTIACGQGSLRPLHLQRPGKRVLDAAAFLRGMPIPPLTQIK